MAGGGDAWTVNSQQSQIRPWSDDPVSDRSGEAIYRRDEDGTLWNPTTLAIREEAFPYFVRHGQGYIRFEHTSHGVARELLQFVPANGPIKIPRLTIKNQLGRPRRLSLTAYVEWVLGATRAPAAPFVVTEIDSETRAMFARNHWSTNSGTRVAFADLGDRQRSWTGDREKFLGRNGALDRPAALVGSKRLTNKVGGGARPLRCAANASRTRTRQLDRDRTASVAAIRASLSTVMHSLPASHRFPCRMTARPIKIEIVLG